MSALAMQRSVLHGDFTIERRFRASPAKVFAAFTVEEQKRQWFGCDPEFEMQVMTLDFRVGGKEVNRTGPKGGTVHAMDGVYLDIVPDRRFVMSMVMHLDARKISVSLLTVEFLPDGAGTRLLFTEQYAFLDGYAEVADREEGSNAGLDVLEKYLGERA
jgi:uncharacterized protein YndB with AHSA1/START domain